MTLGEIITFKEPQLQFSIGKHNLAIDPRHGLKMFHPLDYNTGKREFSTVDIGIIAEEGEIDTVLDLLNNLDNLFKPKGRGSRIDYDGFETTYSIPIKIPEKGSDRIILISNSEINDVIGKADAFDNIVTLFNSKIQQYVDKFSGRDILVLQMPKVFKKYFKYNYEDLRDRIKALCVSKHVYTQILTQNSLNPYDMCDDLWNISLALYVKSGGVPWKLADGEENTCFIGISFGIKKSDSGQDILVGLAEVFDVWGESVTIKIIEDQYNSDVGLHLSKQKAKKLIETALEGYKTEKNEVPGRVVIHKTSFFINYEKEGINDALQDVPYDLVHIKTNTSLRLHPDNIFPPKRGTFWKINDEMGVLYTTGYVDEFRTYPGMATASPIEIIRNYGDTDVKTLAEQVFKLTKMNWNTTALMNKEPVTIDYSRKVVSLLKSGATPEGILKDFRYYF